MKTHFARLILVLMSCIPAALTVTASPERFQTETPSSENTPEVTETTPCTVSTDEANTVRLRVGPGANRTSFAFLPADEAFAVLGKAQDDDGGLWWKVDRQEVAPKKSAAEAWVSDEDVTKAGDCDAVQDVNVPPIIPI